jgi:hypothetical protein
VIEIVERLRELKRVFRDVRGLAGSDGALDGRIGFGRHQQAAARNLRTRAGARARLIELAREIGQSPRRARPACAGCCRRAPPCIARRAGIALEAERFPKIEGDHRIARELQHEVAQRADGDLRAMRGARRRALRVPRVHFFQRLFDQLVDQIVGLHAQALAARNLDVRRFLSSSESSMPSSTQVPGVSATIS